MRPTRIVLKRLSILGIIMVSLAAASNESGTNTGDEAPPPKPSKLSADIYEKEDTTQSFSAPVKLIRETDVLEVFFDGKNKGPYLLKDNSNLGVFKERLAKSQKSKSQNVSVTVVEDVITNVESVENKKTEESKKNELDSVLDDILKK